ncbi:MAG: prepilin-type N-terminal cleavage/methylation domain-containing protein [Gammaproteobacteria bacterium]|nr:prepilin-type N-terminal cleavage/methylation domain-containing protein [Gammaproteobacteria bacterium]
MSIHLVKTRNHNHTLRAVLQKSLCLKQSSRGFTIVELVIAVAVVAIIAAMAVGQYSDYAKRTKLTEVNAQLGTIALKLEQYYLESHSYAQSDGSCGVPMPTAEQVDYFLFSCEITDNGTTYTLTASNLASAGLGKPNDYQYGFDSNGRKYTSRFAAVAVDKNCWLKSEQNCF